MNDWVNCLRLVAFGCQPSSKAPGAAAVQQQPQQVQRRPISGATLQSHATRNPGAANAGSPANATCDVLLDKRAGALNPTQQAAGDCVKPADEKPQPQPDAKPGKALTTASQAAAAAASALAKTRQRQPSLLGSCKPQPPTDSPFIRPLDEPDRSEVGREPINPIGQLDTMTPTVRGQLISAVSASASLRPEVVAAKSAGGRPAAQAKQSAPATLDEEEENMLYCSIEDNPSEHNYRVKVIETELALRCQLKCYPLVASTTVSQQYEQLANLQARPGDQQGPDPVTFYQLIIGPQELTLLNDYAATAANLKLQQQGLWSWPYQCIRRYGFDKDNCFMFEAGRKCTSGPGQFIVQTPKAHTIYRDVVKFVNELRSLSSSIQLDSTQTNTTISDKLLVDKAVNMITQIPVTWTPQQTKTSADSSQTRQQFFDTLRQAAQPIQQVPASDGPLPAKQAAAGSPTSPPNQPKMGLSASSNLAKDNQAPQRTDIRAGKVPNSSSPDETTDESGYEQGDDSVESSRRSKAHNLAANRRRPPASEPMSSASSTTSGGGSPAQSVSRHLGASAVSNDGVTVLQKPTNKRPSLLGSSSLARDMEGPQSLRQKQDVKSVPPPIPRKPVIHKASADRLLGFRMILNEDGCHDQPDDFETNLMRDVYSEITKLHAKFAVTSGSAEDLMSSGNSSHESSASDNQSSYLTNEQELDESANDSADSTRSNEPMYSNLGNKQLNKPTRAGILLREELEADDDLDEILDAGRDLDSDRAPVGKGSQVMSRQRLIRQQSAHDLSSGYYRGNQYSSHNGLEYLSAPSARACGGPLYPTPLNPIPEYGESGSSNQSWNLENCGAGGKPHPVGSIGCRGHRLMRDSDGSIGELPTKHYVINDVQYAKISREMNSNFESCL